MMPSSRCSTSASAKLVLLVALFLFVLSAHDSHAHAPPKLCLEVQDTLAQVQHALQDKGTLVAPRHQHQHANHPTFAKPDAAPNITTTTTTTTAATATSATSATKQPPTIDLSPIYRMLHAMDCEADVLQPQETAPQAHGVPAGALPRRDTSSHDPFLSRDALPRNQRGRREALPNSNATTVVCTFTSIVETTCQVPNGVYSLTIVFEDDVQDAPSGGGASAQHLQSISAGVQRLELQGQVYHAPMLWITANGDWQRVEAFAAAGLQFRVFDMGVLNAFPALTKVAIENSGSTQVHLGDFAHASTLRHLSLRNTSLTAIPGNVLAGLSALTALDLTHNRVTAVGADALRGLTALTTLSLQHNSITTMHSGAFERLSSLTTLSLAFNGISALPPTVFAPVPSLKHLDLSINPLRKLDARLLRPLVALEECDLNGVLLEGIPAGAFAPAAQSLTTLHLDHNLISELDEGAFANLTALRLLDLANNGITAVHADAFQDLTSLRRLFMADNSLTSLPQHLLRACTRLEGLSLDRNELTALPPMLLQATTELTHLLVSQNRLTSLDVVLQHLPRLENVVALNNQLTSFNVAPPALQGLTLNHNPITTLPDVAAMPQLNAVRMRGHRIQSLDLTPLLSLQRLEVLELDAADDVVSTATADPAALRSWSGNSLHTLRMTNVDAGAIFANAHMLPRGRFQVLAVGWPGLDERVIAIEELCPLLQSPVREFGIVRSGYTHMSLCGINSSDAGGVRDSRSSNITFLAVSLQENEQLQAVTLHSSAEQVNVSGCRALRHLDAPSIEVLDMSGTQVPPMAALCVSLGHRMLFARNLPAETFSSALGVALFGSCLTLVDVLDVSNNAWLDSLERVVPHFGTEIVLLDREVISLSFDMLPFRTTPPVLQLNNAPIQCGLRLERRDFRERERSSLSVSPVVYWYECSCARGFRATSGRRCVSEDTDIAAVAAGSSFGGLAMGLLMAWLALRYRRLTARLGHNQQLLLETHEEVLALKKAWEIGFDELQLTKRVAAGAFGVVYKAQWDTVTVAVKVLQQGVMALDETTVEEFEKEVEFLRRTRHPHVVRFFGAGTDPSGSPFLVLEFVAMGSLTDLLEKDMKVVVREHDFSSSSSSHHESEAEAGSAGQQSRKGKEEQLLVWELKLRLLRDVTSGMAFIHSLDQVHRDLKSGNVLVSGNLRAKITDFGSIRQCLAGTGRSRHGGAKAHASGGRRGQGADDPVYSQAVGMTTLVSMTMTTGVGTPLYMAPEALSGAKYNAKADVFSFGVLMWEVAMQEVPDLIKQEKGKHFRGPLMSTLDSLLHQGKRMQFPEEAVPSWYRELAQACMAGNPTQRPSFQDMLHSNHFAASASSQQSQKQM